MEKNLNILKMNSRKNSTYIIAEAGVNHDGSLTKAKKLIDVAKSSGADAVKFQTFSAENLATINSPKANYQLGNNKNESQYRMLKRLELTKENHFILKKYCKKKKIEFISSAFSLEDIDFLNRLNLKTFKIPSGEINNRPYLEKIGKLNKKVILSTGMATVNEISHAIKLLIYSGLKKKKISLLHCVSEYPADIKNLNLRFIRFLEKNFELNIGFSDHSTSIIVPSLAVSVGAKIIEKHLTLSNSLNGPDHKSSLNPNNFRKMILMVRQAEKALGLEKKRISKEESQNRLVVRKSIVAKKNIKKNEILSYENITFKRPGKGISPMKIYNFLGKRSKKNFKKDEYIK